MKMVTNPFSVGNRKICLPYDVAEKALALLLEGTEFQDLNLSTSVRPIDRSAQEADKLEMVISAFRDHVRSIITPIRRQQNILLPIYRLPDELLGEVFLHISKHLVDVERYCANKTLTLVSSRWRSTAISSPKLWDHVSSNFKPKIAELMLERSKQAPLTVLCQERYEKGAQRFFKLVLPHMSRWKSLRVESQDSSRVVSKYIAGKYLPSLETLTLAKTEHSQDPGMSLNITAPSLKLLGTSSHQFPLRLEVNLHSKLTILQFTACLNGNPFLSEHYHILLSSAPSLRELSISGCRTAENPDAHFDNSVGIYLADIQSLFFSDLPEKTIGYLITSISTAPNRYPHVRIMGESSGSISGIFSRPPIPNSLFEVISSSHWAHVAEDFEGDDEFLFVKAGFEGPDRRRDVFEMELECNRLSLAEKLSNMMEAGCFSHLRELETRGLAFFVGRHLGPKFRFLPCLETLKIRSGNEGPEEHADLFSTISSIASSSPSDHSEPQSCPQLRHLALDTVSIDTEALVELMEARSSETGTPSLLRCRLELVELSDEILLPTSLAAQRLHQLAEQRNIELQIRDLSAW